MCETHINDAVRNNFRVKKVTSSHSKAQTVIVAEEDIPDDKLKEVVEKAGLREQTESLMLRKDFSASENNDDIKKIGMQFAGCIPICFFITSFPRSEQIPFLQKE